MKIKVFCIGGISTSRLVTKMQEVASTRGMDAEIGSFPETTFDTETNDCDVALFAPQIHFLLEKAQLISDPKGVPCAVIDRQDYENIDAEAVLDVALTLAKK